MTACAGRNIFEIVLKNSGKRLATINFILHVERAAMDADTIQSETVLKELNAIIDSVADAEAAADRAEETAQSVEASAEQIETNKNDIADLKEDLEKKSGLTQEAKVALLACFANVAWINDQGQTYYDNLEAALYEEEQVTRYAIANTLTHCATSNHASSVIENMTYATLITAESDYAVTYVQVTMDGVDITSTVYNEDTGAINISSVIGDVTITAFGYSLWHMDTDDAHSLIQLNPGGINYTSPYVYVNGGNAYHRTGVLTKVKSSPQPLGICDNNGQPTGEISDFYLIPVPSSAERVNGTIVSSGNVIAIEFFTANSDGTYTTIAHSGYQTSTPGSISYTFPEELLTALAGDDPVVMLHLSKYGTGQWYSDDPSFRPTRATIDFVSSSD